MKTIKFLVMAIIFLAAGFFLGQSYQLPDFLAGQDQEVIENQSQTVTYSLQFSETELIEFQNIELEGSQTVLDILNKLTSENQINLEVQEYEGLGSLVTKIGEQENGQDNKYWQYYVNGEQVQVGAAQYQLKDGDNVEWKFKESEF